MGHRALVAYERTDSTYNLHHSHWGHSISGCSIRPPKQRLSVVLRRAMEKEVHTALVHGINVGDVWEPYPPDTEHSSDIDLLPL